MLLIVYRPLELIGAHFFFVFFPSHPIPSFPSTDIYADGNTATALFSGFISPTRYFTEGIAAAEHRCLPEQIGFTTDPAIAVNFQMEFSSFHFVGLGLNDSNVWIQSCEGFYWGVFPALMVGFTVRFIAAGVIHITNRSQQVKKPLSEILSSTGNPVVRKRFIWTASIFLVLVVVFIFLSGFLIIRKA